MDANHTNNTEVPDEQGYRYVVHANVVNTKKFPKQVHDNYINRKKMTHEITKQAHETAVNIITNIALATSLT